MPKVDAPITNIKEPRGKRWIEVPAKDLFDFTYPTIRVNLLEFPPGRHYVDAELADFIESRMELKFQSDVRVMRPNQDLVSQHAMNRFGAGARQGNFVKNPDTEMA